MPWPPPAFDIVGDAIEVAPVGVVADPGLTALYGDWGCEPGPGEMRALLAAGIGKAGCDCVGAPGAPALPAPPVGRCNPCEDGCDILCVLVIGRECKFVARTGSIDPSSTLRWRAG